MASGRCSAFQLVAAISKAYAAGNVLGRTLIAVVTLLA